LGRVPNLGHCQYPFSAGKATNGGFPIATLPAYTICNRMLLVWIVDGGSSLMMASEACAQAHVLMAGLAEVVGSLSSSWLLAADYAVCWCVYECRVMIHGQCSCTGMTSSSAVRPSIGRQTLHEFVSELPSEGEVRFVGMLHLPQPERIENADVDEPPHQVRLGR